MFHLMQVCSRRSVQLRAAHVNQIWVSGMPPRGLSHRCLPFQPAQKSPVSSRPRATSGRLAILVEPLKPVPCRDRRFPSFFRLAARAKSPPLNSQSPCSLLLRGCHGPAAGQCNANASPTRMLVYTGPRKDCSRLPISSKSLGGTFNSPPWRP